MAKKKKKRQETQEGMTKLNRWQERLRKNSAAMADEFVLMDKRTALYNGTREIDKVPGAKSKGKSAQATGVRNIVAELMEAQVDSSFPMPTLLPLAYPAAEDVTSLLCLEHSGSLYWLFPLPGTHSPWISA